MSLKIANNEDCANELMKHMIQRHDLGILFCVDDDANRDFQPEQTISRNWW